MKPQPFGDVLVVVPGILGSTLLDMRGRTLWSTSAGRLVPCLARLVVRRNRLTVPAGVLDRGDPNGITPGPPIDDLHAIPGLWEIDGYGRLISWLQQRFELRPPTDNTPGNLIAFGYDWRLSCRHNARLLAEIARRELTRWRGHVGRDDPKLTLICHSMGGLVARWFLDVEGGHELTRRLVTVGTPYQGAPKALNAIVNGVAPGLGPLRVDLTAIARSCPSVYELLPTYPCACPDDSELRLARPTEAGFGDPSGDDKLWALATNFHDQLRAAAPKTAGTYKIFAFKSPLQPTDQVFTRRRDGAWELDDLEDRDGDPTRAYVRTRDDGGYEPLPNTRGDGTVPRGSSHPAEWPSEDDTPANGHVHGFIARHAHLQHSDALLDSLFQVLTADGLGKTAGGRELGLRLSHDLVAPGEPFTIEVFGDRSLNAPLRVLLDGDERNPIELEFLGNGRYRASIDGITYASADSSRVSPDDSSPDQLGDVRTLAVVSASTRNPVEPVETTITIFDPARAERWVNWAETMAQDELV